MGTAEDPRIRIDPSVGDPARFRERRFVLDVLHAAFAHPVWPGHIDRAVVLSGHSRHTRWPALEAPGPKPLVVVLGDEDARMRPELRRAAAAVLQSYRPAGATGDPPVLGLPLGPGGPEDEPPLVPWPDRDRDVVFVGHLHKRRWGLARALGAVGGPARHLPDGLLAAARRHVLQPVELPGWRTDIRFTTRFGAGVPRPAYLSLLGRARVALVPPGFKQDESFRHHEAARAGCVLVGAALADDRYPVLVPPAGADLRPWLARLLADEDRLQAQHAAVVAAWRARGRAAAVGAAVAARLAAGLATAGHP